MAERGNTERGMGGHQSSRMLSDIWLTPQWILGPLGVFDLDPCAAPEPRPWPTALRHITRPTDGLSQPWHGRVWLNPPYSRHVGGWLSRLAEHGTGTALVFARTETTWFIDHVWGKATALVFLHGRVRFHHPDGRLSVENSGAPSVLVAYGEGDAAALQRSRLGTYVEIPLNRPQVATQLMLVGVLHE